MCSVFVLKDQDYNSNMIDYRRDKVKRRYYDERYLQRALGTDMYL